MSSINGFGGDDYSKYLQNSQQASKPPTMQDWLRLQNLLLDATTPEEMETLNKQIKEMERQMSPKDRNSAKRLSRPEYIPSFTQKK